MKKILATLGLLAVATLGLAAPASANGDDTPAENKKVTLCHATSSETNPYNKITVSVAAFYNAGHIDHAGDFWEAFSYTTKGGDVVNVPAQGDTSLLAFDDCVAPRVDEQVAKPDVTFQDLCGTKNDVFSVAPGRGYTVGATQSDGVIQSITVSLNEGFVWADGSHEPLRFEKPVFTNEDCDLPETGAAAVYNTPAGIAALAGIALLGLATVATTRRRKV
jgi:hypothetical protein